MTERSHWFGCSCGLDTLVRPFENEGIRVCSVDVCRCHVQDFTESFQLHCVDPFDRCLRELCGGQSVQELRPDCCVESEDFKASGTVAVQPESVQLFHRSENLRDAGIDFFGSVALVIKHASKILDFRFDFNGVPVCEMDVWVSMPGVDNFALGCVESETILGAFLFD